jgi:peptidoglycan hydrolase FlgJ
MLTTRAPVYTDLGSLSALKRDAARHDPAAIRQVAQQFESLFTRMMLKSMRDASGTDPMFGSDQQKMYRDMADDQLAVQLAKGKGLGLADVLLRQLRRLGVAGADGGEAGQRANGSALARPAALGAYSAVAGHGAAGSEPEERSRFVSALWPHARQAADELGVDPSSLIAQAALETNWGRQVPQTAAGSSHNLFGIKASDDWRGATARAGTGEFQNGTSTRVDADFRAYAGVQQSFADYVALLRTPRYAAALNTGANVRAFGEGLQRGGYATDPDYVRKLDAVAGHVQSALAGREARPAELKLSTAAPISTGSGAL